MAEENYDDTQQYDETQYDESNPNQYSYDYTYEDNYNPNITAWGTALYKYDAQEDDQLTFNEGDTIGIIEDLGDGWSRGDLNGYEGLFPTDYVQIYQEGEQEAVAQKKTGLSQEEMSARKEKRDKLKEQLKAMKEELAAKQKETETLEASLNTYTETKQKLKKELQTSRATMSEKFTILFDVMKLADALDNYCDSMRENVQPTNQVNDALKTFDAELGKEAKNSSSLTPFVHQIGNRTKVEQANLSAYTKQIEDSVQNAKDLSQDLAKLQKLLPKNA